MPASTALGLYGGSFDPVHRGHLETALEVQQRLSLAELRFLPAARSPLKTSSSAHQHRLAMLDIALAPYPSLQVDARELQRPPPSYTIDSLSAIRAEQGPQRPLIFILGVDSLLALPRWRRWQELTGLAHLLVVSRPGFQADFSPELAHWLKTVRTDEAALLQSRPFGHLLFLETQPWPLASRDIRAAIGQGRDVSPLLPPGVWDYIQEHGLYTEQTHPHESA